MHSHWTASPHSSRPFCCERSHVDSLVRVCAGHRVPQAAQRPKSDAGKEKAANAAAGPPRRVTRSQTRATSQDAIPGAEARGAAASGSRRSAQGSATQQRRQPQQQALQLQQSAQLQQQQDQPIPQPSQQEVQAQQQQRQQHPALPPLPDIDCPDRHNHLAECRYVNDIYAFFRHIEPKYRAPANYMESQVG
jgi:cyclin B